MYISIYAHVCRYLHIFSTSSGVHFVFFVCFPFDSALSPKLTDPVTPPAQDTSAAQAEIQIFREKLLQMRRFTLPRAGSLPAGQPQASLNKFHSQRLLQEDNQDEGPRMEFPRFGAHLGFFCLRVEDPRGILYPHS